jgi:hypothetical protein
VVKQQVKKMTKKEAKTRKAKLAHDIRNLKDDYAGVSKEDMPQDVIDELAGMMAELKAIHSEYPPAVHVPLGMREVEEA